MPTYLPTVSTLTALSEHRLVHDRHESRAAAASSSQPRLSPTRAAQCPAAPVSERAKRSPPCMRAEAHAAALAAKLCHGLQRPGGASEVANNCSGGARARRPEGKGKGKGCAGLFARLPARPAAAATIGLHRGLWLAFETVRDQDVCRSRLGRPRCSRLSLDRFKSRGRTSVSPAARRGKAAGLPERADGPWPPGRESAIDPPGVLAVVHPRHAAPSVAVPFVHA